MSAAAGLDLTTRQRQVLDYLRAFLCANHQLPPASKLAADFGWTSNNAAADMLKRLECRGALVRNEIGKLMLAPAALGQLPTLEKATA